VSQSTFLEQLQLVGKDQKLNATQFIQRRLPNCTGHIMSNGTTFMITEPGENVEVSTACV